MLIYADESDLSTWLSMDPPANAAQLLRSASLLVTDGTSGDYYDVDGTGMPSDADTLQAFNDATCAQAAMWMAAGIDPATAGLPPAGPVRLKKIGTGQVEYDTAGQTTVTMAQARQIAAQTLCDESLRILNQAGLAKTSVWTYG